MQKRQSMQLFFSTGEGGGGKISGKSEGTFFSRFIRNLSFNTYSK